jgi:hypothetical protein
MLAQATKPLHKTINTDYLYNSGIYYSTNTNSRLFKGYCLTSSSPASSTTNPTWLLKITMSPPSLKRFKKLLQNLSPHNQQPGRKESPKVSHHSYRMLTIPTNSFYHTKAVRQKSSIILRCSSLSKTFEPSTSQCNYP